MPMRRRPRRCVGLGKSGRVGEYPAKILAQTRTGLAGEGPRLVQLPVEVLRTVRQLARFQFFQAARCVLAHQHEVSRVGHKHLAVAFPVAADLITLCRQPRVVIGGLYLDNGALWRLPVTRHASLYLLRPVEAEIRVARPLVGRLTDTEHFRLERPTDGVEQVG